MPSLSKVGSKMLDGALPAISGASLTNLDARDLENALPAISGASLTSLPAQGITEADQWRLTTSFTANASPISSNLERVDTDAGAGFGTRMTQSSGIFTFPSTGFWLVGMQGVGYSTSADSQRFEWRVEVTEDNTNYTTAATSMDSVKYFSSLDTWCGDYCQHILDVTNTSLTKVRFCFGAGQGGETCAGNSAATYTGMFFIRLGDT